MKKTLIALAVLAASGATMAQSSVTLYGIADAFVGSRETNTVTAVGTDLVASKQRQSVVDSGGLNSSRWGLKGSEDLGNGLKANFVLESTINIDKGTDKDEKSGFDRQAFVGLSGSFGAVSMGRQYNEFYNIRGKFLSAQAVGNTFDATNGVAFNKLQADSILAYITNPGATEATAAAAALNTHAGRIGAWTGNETRINNSLRYETPEISGFKAAVVYGMGEDKSGATDATRNVSGSLAYTNGPIGVALVHSTDELVKGIKLKNTAVGGFYDLGVAKAFLSYNEAKYTGVAKQDEWAVGVRAPIGATTLVAQYAQSNGDDLGKSQSFGLEAQYSLSKRTTAYAAFNETKAYDDFLKNNVFGLGMRHTF
jgi:predicted porin